MKKILLLPTLAICIVSGLLNAQEKRSVENPQIYYIASGENPSWSLIVTGDEIRLTKSDLNMSFPYVKPIDSAGVKIFRATRKKEFLQLNLFEGRCEDSVSQMTYAYSSKVIAKRKKDKKPVKLVGCGTYSRDTRLNTVWRLESLKGTMVKPYDFGSELPYLDLHVSENAFSGFGGCNRISGELGLEDTNRIAFKNVISTKMACLSDNREPEFMKVLQETSTYVISGNRLILYVNGNPQAVLVKVI